MLSTTDPCDRRIRLSQETWDQHIVKKHSDIVPDWIAETIETPHYITRDTIKRKRCHLRLCYYRMRVLPPSYGRDYLKVVVNQRSRKRPFFVITAYPAHRIKLETEEIIWTHLTPSSSKQPT